MARPKLVLTDVDGSIVSFAKPFHDWMAKAGYHYDAVTNLENTFEIDRVFGISDELARSEVGRFSDAEVFASLPPLLGAQEAISALRSDGWRFVAITACHRSDASCEWRRANLKQLFNIEFDDVLFSGLLGSKAELLQRYEPCYWVEDSLTHSREGFEAGHIPIIMDRAYNKMSDGSEFSNAIVRVNNWFDIEDYLSHQIAN